MNALEKQILKELPKNNWISVPYIQRKFKASYEDATDAMHRIADQYDVIQHYEGDKLVRISMFTQMRRIIKKTFLW